MNQEFENIIKKFKEINNKNKGINFAIKKDEISKLFQNIYTYEN